ncbi:MAG TPA: hypothetical protein DHN33_07190 [Eubacteriaceae bacterium]|nr:hypothetical protein [Eubacteriaceae bacterium]
MKKQFVLIGILVVFLLLFGCSGGNENDNDTDDPQPNNGEQTDGQTEEEENESEENEDSLLGAARDYFPALEDSRLVYEGEGNEYASFEIYFDYIEDNRMQVKNSNPGTELVEIFVHEEDRVVQVFQKGEVYYRENQIDDYNQNEILIMEPIEVGHEWQASTDVNRKITGVDVSVETPIKTYQTIEITVDYEDSSGVTKEYYAKDVGLVERIYETEDGAKITSTLEKIEEDAANVQTIDFYYPDIEENKLKHNAVDLAFYTNEVTRLKLGEAYKENVEVPVLTENTTINYLYLNEDGMVYVDLSEDYIQEMNAGAQYESMMLQGIANTVGRYYGVERVYLTIESEPYSSGHILMEKGEYIQVE